MGIHPQFPIFDTRARFQRPSPKSAAALPRMSHHCARAPVCSFPLCLRDRDGEKFQPIAEILSESEPPSQYLCWLVGQMGGDEGAPSLRVCVSRSRIPTSARTHEWFVSYGPSPTAFGLPRTHSRSSERCVTLVQQGNQRDQPTEQRCVAGQVSPQVLSLQLGFPFAWPTERLKPRPPGLSSCHRTDSASVAWVDAHSSPLVHHVRRIEGFQETMLLGGNLLRKARSIVE